MTKAPTKQVRAFRGLGTLIAPTDTVSGFRWSRRTQRHSACRGFFQNLVSLRDERFDVCFEPVCQAKVLALSEAFICELKVSMSFEFVASPFECNHVLDVASQLPDAVYDVP